MRKLICGLILAVSCWLACRQSFAHSLANDTVIRQLDEVEVAADKQKPAVTSSSPVQIINSENFNTSGITDIADAMRRMAGINLRDYGGAGGLKTVSIRGLGAQHTGVVYDGAPVSDIQSGQIDISRYSLQNISSLSLYMGDADDVYLPARIMASASNIRINTLLSPDLTATKPEVNFKIRLASFQTLNPFLRFAKSNGQNLAFSVSADYLHSLNNYPFFVENGVASSREKRQNSLINSGHAEAFLIWKPKASQSLGLKVYYYDNGRQLPGPVIIYADPSHERLRENNLFSQVDYKIKFNSKFSLRALAKYNRSYTRYRDENGKYPGGKLDDRYIQNEEYVSSTLLYLPFENLKFSYAFDYFHNSLHDNSPVSDKPGRDSFLQALSAGYEVWRLKLTVRGLVSIVNDYSNSLAKKTASRISPSVSLSLKVLENYDWYLRTSYKNIFRMPSFNELYFNHYGTVNLDPEITDQFNFGTGYSHSGRNLLNYVQITIDAYLNRIHNKIVAMPYNMFVWTMTNLGKVRSYGVDLTLNADFKISGKHHLDISGNYSYQRAAPRTDRNYPDWNKQLPYTPLSSGAFSLAWLNPWINFSVHANGCSSRYSTTLNVPETRMGGYMEFGFTLFRDFKIKDSTLEVRGDIINAFNRQYEVVRRYPMPGRSFAITFGYKLN